MRWLLRARDQACGRRFDDPVCEGHTGGAVGDDDNDPHPERLDAGLHGGRRALQIINAGRFVEDENGSTMQRRSDKCQALLLPA